MSSEGDNGSHRVAGRHEAKGERPHAHGQGAMTPPERIDSMRPMSVLRVDDPGTRVMDTLGERWTFLILRQAFFGVRRFNQMQRGLGVSRNILADRLRKLVDAGILKRRRYRQNPDFYEYRLTARGLALYPAILVFSAWGDRYLAGDPSRTLVLRHKPCGEVTNPVLVCSCCGEPIHARDMAAEVVDRSSATAEAGAVQKLRTRSART